MSQPIRLTNKTAISLRKMAARVRRMHMAAAVVTTIVLVIAALAVGLRWLWAVPLVVIACVLLDAVILVSGRCRYLQLVGQAICTEAASREIRAGVSEQRRREQAISDLMSVKADIQRAERSADKVIAQSVSPLLGRESEQPDDEDDDYVPVSGRGSGGKAQEPEQDEGEAQEDHASPRRRRRQSSLQLIRSSQG